MKSHWKIRVEPRYRLDVLARVRTEGTFHWHEARMINLSRSGACLHSKAHLDPSQPIEVEVPIATNDAQQMYRRIFATIIWKRAMRYGLKFEKSHQAESKKTDSK